MKRVYKIYWSPKYAMPEVGKAYIFFSRENVMTGTESFHLMDWDPEKGGIPGNINPSIRRYHGWRGTYGNTATYALGVRRVDEIIRFKQDDDGNYYFKVRLSAKDLVADED